MGLKSGKLFCSSKNNQLAQETPENTGYLLLYKDICYVATTVKVQMSQGPFFMTPEAIWSFILVTDEAVLFSQPPGHTWGV